MRVYVETNWLVASVFPQHARHADAVRLLKEAETGACSLHIPAVAFLEARHTVESKAVDDRRMMKAAIKEMSNVARNLGDAELLALVVQTQTRLDERLAGYDPMQELRALVERCQHRSFSYPAEELQALDRVREELPTKKGADLVDLYILTAIAVDREMNPSGPAVVFSTDKGEFKPRIARSGARSFYDRLELVYRDDFDLQQAMAIWSLKFRSQ